MTPYQASWVIRYSMPTIQQQIETATIHCTVDIANEDPTTPDHANRLAWANWANANSGAAWIPFGWPVSLNPTIQAAVQADPSGQSVVDSDVQFVVSSNLNAVIANWKPPV